MVCNYRVLYKTGDHQTLHITKDTNKWHCVKKIDRDISLYDTKYDSSDEKLFDSHKMSSNSISLNILHK